MMKSLSIICLLASSLGVSLPMSVSAQVNVPFERCDWSQTPTPPLTINHIQANEWPPTPYQPVKLTLSGVNHNETITGGTWFDDIAMGLRFWSNNYTDLAQVLDGQLPLELGSVDFTLVRLFGNEVYADDVSWTILLQDQNKESSFCLQLAIGSQPPGQVSIPYKECKSTLTNKTASAPITSVTAAYWPPVPFVELPFQVQVVSDYEVVSGDWYTLDLGPGMAVQSGGWLNSTFPPMKLPQPAGPLAIPYILSMNEYAPGIGPYNFTAEAIDQSDTSLGCVFLLYEHHFFPQQQFEKDVPRVFVK